MSEFSRAVPHYLRIYKCTYIGILLRGHAARAYTYTPHYILYCIYYWTSPPHAHGGILDAPSRTRSPVAWSLRTDCAAALRARTGCTGNKVPRHPRAPPLTSCRDIAGPDDDGGGDECLARTAHDVYNVTVLFRRRRRRTPLVVLSYTTTRAPAKRWRRRVHYVVTFRFVWRVYLYTASDENQFIDGGGRGVRAVLALYVRIILCIFCTISTSIHYTCCVWCINQCFKHFHFIRYYVVTCILYRVQTYSLLRWDASADNMTKRLRSTAVSIGRNRIRKF